MKEKILVILLVLYIILLITDITLNRISAKQEKELKAIEMQLSKETRMQNKLLNEQNDLLNKYIQELVSAGVSDGILTEENRAGGLTS